MSSSTIDVLIVGAGPVGLVAALVLAQSGVSIRVIDKVPNFDNIGQRGAGIQPRAVEAYKFLGVLDDMTSKGTFETWKVKAYDVEGNLSSENSLGKKHDATPQIPFPNGLRLGQDSNCAILRQHLKALGVEVEVATEMMSFEQDEDGATATIKVHQREGEEKVRTKFLLGTDGAKGITRRIAGIHFEGETKETMAVIGDVELKGAGFMLDSGMIMHNFVDADKNKVLIRSIPEDDAVHNIFLVVTSLDIGRLTTDKTYLQEQLRLISHSPDLEVSKVRSIFEWRLNERVADRFKVGRVLIAGDAAHGHSPMGGQGLNSGVLDAMNVAWKLASVIKFNSPLSLLDTYEEERLPVIREMLHLTAQLADKAFKGPDVSPSAWQRPSAARQLGVHCRWSGIVRDELQQEGSAITGTVVEPEDVYGLTNNERLHAGDRAPDAPGLVSKAKENMSLFNLFKPTLHTVIVFDPAIVKDVLATIDAYPNGSARVVAVLPEALSIEGTEVYVDSQGHAQRAYGVEAGVKAGVVRPDGVVGGLLQSADGVAKYFSKVFAI